MGAKCCVPGLKCTSSSSIQFRIQADELENKNQMLFGDTDAQGLACDASISLRDTSLIATALCAEQ